jgi:hypothetical protein
MPQHTIYVTQEQEREIQKTARRLQVKPTQVIRLQLEAAKVTSQLRSLHRKLDALFLILETVLPELGFAAGATRSASAPVTSAVKEGEMVRSAFELALRRLRGEFQHQEDSLL